MNRREQAFKRSKHWATIVLPARHLPLSLTVLNVFFCAGCAALKQLCTGRAGTSIYEALNQLRHQEAEEKRKTSQ